MSSAAPRSKPFIRPAVPKDCLELAGTMREEDVQELWHSSRSLPFDALHQGFILSEEVFAIERDGKVAAMFGVVPFPERGAGPWMLGSPDLKRCKSLLRECRARVDAYTERHGFLANACWSKNGVHIEWIKWLGFNFHGSDTRNGETFLHFNRTRNV